MSKLFEQYLENITNKVKNDWNEADIRTLNDYEVNHLVAALLYQSKKDIFVEREIPSKPGVIVAKGEMSLGLYDFCNNANDAYPIMFKEGIGVRRKIMDKKIWEANVEFVRESDNYSYDLHASDKSPLRAMMAVYLIKYG